MIEKLEALNARLRYQIQLDRVKRLQLKMHEALEALELAAEEISDRLGRCEHCGCDMFEGDPVLRAEDGILYCEAHSPMLSQLIEAWEGRIATQAEPWFELGFETEFEMMVMLGVYRNDLAKNGDRNLSHPTAEETPE